MPALLAHIEPESECFTLCCGTTRRMRNVYNIIKHTSRAPPTKKKKTEIKRSKRGASIGKKFNLLAFYEPKSKSLTIIKKRKPRRRRETAGFGPWPKRKADWIAVGGRHGDRGRSGREIKKRGSEEGRSERGWACIALWKQQSLRLLRARARALWLRHRKCEWCWWWADGDRTAQRTVTS